ncbi:hypothetical protein BC937DRAFT_91275 [Endogone sp. FLAS-F59071]|nr:hypothetical protein BC937DRAFT_91275 [Endogone sp. FLAS-F59071]|eukprot:RUS16381.1 hypothetical protein BC937DRAFT_91275 [Endogone sp. FLAS-F59071]
MDNGDLLPVVLDGKIKREASNTLGLGAGDNLERFHDAGVGLQIDTENTLQTDHQSCSPPLPQI